jgi:hypothetical protein
MILHNKIALPLKKNWQSIIGFFLIFSAAIALNKNSTLPGWWILMPTIGAFLIINAGPDAWLNGNFLNNPKLVWFGLISYPLYLWHWPIFSFTRIIFFEKEINPLILILAIFISVLFAWLTHKFIEKKIRYNQKNVTALVLLTICIFCVLIGLSIQQKKLLARHNDMNIKFIYNALEDTGSDNNKFQREEINHLDYYYLGNRKKENVLFIGDSHVGQYIPRIIKLSENPNFDMKFIYLAIINGCSIIPDVFDDSIKKCRKKWTERLDFILNSKIFDSVVIGSCWNCMLTSTVNNPVISSTKDPRRKHALNVLENLLARMAATKKVYLLLDNPNNKLFNPRNFFNGSRLKKLTLKDLKPVQLDNEKKELREELIAIAHRTGAVVIDPIPSLCPDNQCHILTNDGDPIYVDNHHLSASWVKKFSNYIDIAVKVPGKGLYESPLQVVEF